MKNYHCTVVGKDDNESLIYQCVVTAKDEIDAQKMAEEDYKLHPAQYEGLYYIATREITRNKMKSVWSEEAKKEFWKKSQTKKYVDFMEWPTIEGIEVDATLESMLLKKLSRFLDEDQLSQTKEIFTKYLELKGQK